MTRDHAAKLRLEWKTRGDLPCDHVLELETQGVYVTGAYVCLLCGAHIITTPSAAPLDPTPANS